MNTRSVRALMVSLMLVAGVTSPLAAAAGAAPRVTQSAGGVWMVEGTFRIDRPMEAVWEVLTDYEGFPHFVRGMRESHIRPSRSGGVLLEQEVRAKALMFQRTLHLVLTVEETAPRALRFRDVSRRDFELYEGNWTLRPDADGVQVTYRLRAKPTLSLPAFIGSGVIAENADALLKDVRAEILRRAAAQSSQRVGEYVR